MKQTEKRPIVKLTQQAKSLLTILAKRSGTTELNYASGAITFIYQLGIDIFAKSQPYIPDLVKNLERRIIGFMKKRESDFFVPMDKKVMALTQSHVKLFDALEALDVVKYASDTFEKNAPFATADPSPSQDLEASELSLELEAHKKQSEAEKQQMKLHPAKAKKQAEIFKNELEFLMGSISKAGALSKGKVMLNITQSDCWRIQKLLEDN